MDLSGACDSLTKQSITTITEYQHAQKGRSNICSGAVGPSGWSKQTGGDWRCRKVPSPHVLCDCRRPLYIVVAANAGQRICSNGSALYLEKPFPYCCCKPLVSFCKHIKHCDQKTKHALNRDMFERWEWKRHGDSCQATTKNIMFSEHAVFPNHKTSCGDLKNRVPTRHCAMGTQKYWRFVPLTELKICSPFWCVVWNARGKYIFHDCPPHFNMTKPVFHVMRGFHITPISTQIMGWLSSRRSSFFMFSIFMWPPASPPLPHTLNPAGSRRHPRWDEQRVVTNQKVIVSREIQRTLLKDHYRSLGVNLGMLGRIPYILIIYIPPAWAVSQNHLVGNQRGTTPIHPVYIRDYHNSWTGSPLFKQTMILGISQRSAVSRLRYILRFGTKTSVWYTHTHIYTHTHTYTWKHPEGKGWNEMKWECIVPRAGFLVLPSCHSETIGIKLVVADHWSQQFCRYVWLIRPDISPNLAPIRWVTIQGREWPRAVDPLFQGFSHTHTHTPKIRILQTLFRGIDADD